MREFGEDNVTDWAGALTYYGVLSLFPALLLLVSLLVDAKNRSSAQVADSNPAPATQPLKVAASPLDFQRFSGPNRAA